MGPSMETLFEELKRYVHWGPPDEEALREMHPVAAPHFARITDIFYARIFDHGEARKALEGGESQVGKLKVSLRAWMDGVFAGPWDEAYYERRARIGRVHVRISLPQHYMFGAMSVLRQELLTVVDDAFAKDPERAAAARRSVGKILDLELAIMLHTYREDLIAQRSRNERLATFGQLVGSIGHELRNPLGVIESSLYILGQRTADERAQKHVTRIGDQVTIANQIIADLLDMIRDRPLTREPVRIGPIMDSVLASVKHPVEVAIVVDGIADLPEIAADGSKLRQVLLNLVENAVHAVGDRGTVRIRGGASNSELWVAVEDDGPGVDATIRGRLFEPLITTKTKGIGLGLPLVRRVVERHGGSVVYEPIAGVKGARFVIRLPLGGADA
jgi:two-component system, NtrC family, sensor histidine kinase HydH